MRLKAIKGFENRVIDTMAVMFAIGSLLMTFTLLLGSCSTVDEVGSHVIKGWQEPDETIVEAEDKSKVYMKVKPLNLSLKSAE